MARKGFSLIELLVVIAVLGSLAIVVLIMLDPVQALAKARDSSRISAIIQLGKTIERFSISQSGNIPNESPTWMDSLVSSGEIKNKAGQVDYITSDTTPCDTNNQNNYCYVTSDSGSEKSFLVYSRLESKSNLSKCGSDYWAYIVYSSADTSAGIVCSSQGNSNLVSGNQNFATSFNVSGCKNSHGNIEVVIPNGGEIFTVGDTIKIQWCLNDFTKYNQTYSHVTLSSRQGQTNGYVYQNQVTISSKAVMQPGLNTMDWIIPTDLGLEGGSFVILVSSGSNGVENHDFSDETFTIKTSSNSGNPSDKGGCASSKGSVEVIAPNSGGGFKVGDKMVIIWCVNDYSQYNKSYASVRLSTRETQNDGTYLFRNHTVISDKSTMTPGLNTLDWTIPEILGGEVFVISASINSFNPNYDYSDNTFSIKNSSISSVASNNVSCPDTSGRVKVVNPNNGESFKIGDKLSLEWCVNTYSEYNQTYASVSISSPQTGASYTLSSNTPMKAGGNLIEWTIPSNLTPGSYSAFVRINSWFPNYDTSDKNFSITSQ